MKRLIVCCDGTWNNPEQEDNGIAAPTNVVKIHNALAELDASGNRQCRFYHPGVGGEDSGFIDSVLGGALGVGISRHICSAYHWLCNNYEDDDEIYLFGFSRGAFTVRSLGGFLGKGLLDLRDVPSDDAWERIKAAYDDGYRGGKSLSQWAEPQWKFFNQRRAMPVQFIGVWDTVGALGIPDDLEILNLFDDRKKWQFHDTALGDNVVRARHAMAIDEVRSSFSITRWKNAEEHSDAKELWFPGVHSDVGGGYAQCDLSSGALKWMMEESGLTFRPGVVDGISGNPSGVMHNSYRGAFQKLRSRPRNLPAMTTANAALFHPGALARQQSSPIEYPPYHPTTELGVGESLTVEVFASKHWNPTSLYLHKGHKYTFSATGKWQDSKDTCDWKGTEDGKLTRGDLVRAASSFLGKFETMFRNLSSNELSDFLGTKRVEELPWFTLVGAIGNDNCDDNAVTNDGSAVPHQMVELARHETTPLVITAPGYLYCFPNDVWSLYGNNHGSLQLTVRRVG